MSETDRYIEICGAEDEPDKVLVTGAGLIGWYPAAGIELMSTLERVYVVGLHGSVERCPPRETDHTIQGQYGLAYVDDGFQSAFLAADRSAIFIRDGQSYVRHEITGCDPF